MKKIFLVLTLFVSLLALAPAGDTLDVNLIEGKNNFNSTIYFDPIYASDLIKTYPQIRSITLLGHGTSVGYVNALGGVGTDFIVEYNQNYEIYTSEQITLKLE